MIAIPVPLAILVFFIVLFAIMIIVARNWEARDFNNGFCPHCGRKLRYFDSDSQGGRGYRCDACEYTTWCSYAVDKNYEN